MIENDKICVAQYLKDLNGMVKYAIDRHYLNADRVEILTCKKLAARCGVTQATVTNLTTSSKFFLLYRVAEEIYTAYYCYFLYEEARCRQDDNDELIHPRDISFVLMCLTSYYTRENLKYLIRG